MWKLDVSGYGLLVCVRGSHYHKTHNTKPTTHNYCQPDLFISHTNTNFTAD